jgi:hypothetical protein
LSGFADTAAVVEGSDPPDQDDTGYEGGRHDRSLDTGSDDRNARAAVARKLLKERGDG